MQYFQETRINWCQGKFVWNWNIIKNLPFNWFPKFRSVELFPLNHCFLYCEKVDCWKVALLLKKMVSYGMLYNSPTVFSTNGPNAKPINFSPNHWEMSAYRKNFHISPMESLKTQMKSINRNCIYNSVLDLFLHQRKSLLILVISLRKHVQVNAS